MQSTAEILEQYAPVLKHGDVSQKGMAVAKALNTYDPDVASFGQYLSWKLRGERTLDYKRQKRLSNEVPLNWDTLKSPYAAPDKNIEFQEELDNLSSDAHYIAMLVLSPSDAILTLIMAKQRRRSMTMSVLRKHLHQNEDWCFNRINKAFKELQTVFK